jgi:SAM-dependent methyltransferase
MSAAAPPVPVAVTWHDAECGGYGSDLPFWERLAAEHGTPILDLGAGTGRVSLHLAARGFDVVAVEREPQLAEALGLRAAERTPSGNVEVVVADVREMELERRFPLIIGPMQLMHMLGGAASRRRALGAIARHLAPGGVFATTVLAEPLPPSGRSEPLPDVRDVDGWIHSSLPLEVVVDDDSLSIVRLRQIVDPAGDLTEEVDTLSVDRLQPGLLERDLGSAGLEVVATEEIPETDEHVGSVALLIKVRSLDV